MNRTFSTCCRWALPAGFLVVALQGGAAFGAVNPEPGGSGCRDSGACTTAPALSRTASLAGDAHAAAVHAQLTGAVALGDPSLARPAVATDDSSSGYYLDRLVTQAHADAVHSQLSPAR